MPINPVDAPVTLDLNLREPPGHSIRSRRPTLRPGAAAPAALVPAAPAEEALQPAEAKPQEGAHVAETAPSPPKLKFSTDEETGKAVVALVDEAGNVVRQMPSAEALKVAEQIGRYQGMFVDLKV